MKYGYIDTPVIGKIKSLLKSIILTAPVEKYTGLKALFYRAERISIVSVVKVTEEEMILMESLLSQLETSESFKLVLFLAFKRNQLEINSKNNNCYLHFNEAYKIRSIKALRYLVRMDCFIKEYGDVSDGLRFCKKMIESNVYVGPLKPELAYMMKGMIERDVPQLEMFVTNKPKRGFSSFIEVAKENNYGF